ncbi:MAG: sigma 54-interacting transcriptional regulator [Leptospiraceae bacterium]|nr:sigma 54-interacting transcriptional regulator [Leptospiraceae bacterium]MDW8307383.1 sigma 54-interacting transcriptional regulator [Leptospiraceae bacterium]
MYSLLWITRSVELKKWLRQEAQAQRGIWQRIHLTISRSCQAALRSVARLGADILVLDSSLLLEEENSVQELLQSLEEKYALDKGEMLLALYFSLPEKADEASRVVLHTLKGRRQLHLIYAMPYGELSAYMALELERAIHRLEILRQNYILRQENQSLLIHRANRLPRQLEFDYSFDFALHIPPPSFLFYQSELGKVFREKLLLAADHDRLTLLLADKGCEVEHAAIFWHQNNPIRRYKPFLRLDFRQIPRKLQWEALLGKTTPSQKQPGAIENAASGTLLLENIQDMDWELQSKIVDILNMRVFQRLGDNKRIPINCQFLFSAPPDLAKLAEKNRIRQDLFYKLQHMPLAMPTIDEVRQDLPAIIDNYNRWYCKRYAKEIHISPEVKDFFCNRSYTANFQELYSLLYRLHSLLPAGVLTFQELLELSELRAHPPSDKAFFQEFYQFLREKRGTLRKRPAFLFEGTLADVEKNYIEQTLERCEHNISRAAKSLGITRKTLYEKMKKFSLNRKSLKKSS